MTDQMPSSNRVFEEEQPRERLVRYGVENLTNQELLAILIRSGSKNFNVMELADKMLKEAGGLHRLAELSYEELCQFDGIKLSKATTILAAMEIAKRVYFMREKDSIKVKHPESIYRAYGHRFIDKKKEEFWILLLDTKHQVIAEEQISVGSLNCSIVHPREVFCAAVRRSAQSIVLMHNHPSGDAQPSREDILVTRRLKESGELLGIEVLDHIILGEHNYFSFKQDGII